MPHPFLCNICLPVVVNVGCQRCAQQTISSLSEETHGGVMRMVVHARVHVLESYMLHLFLCNTCGPVLENAQKWTKSIIATCAFVYELVCEGFN